METPLDRGAAFEVEEFWRNPCFATTNDPVDSLFGEIDTTPIAPTLISAQPDQSLFEFKLPLLGNVGESPPGADTLPPGPKTANSLPKDDKIVENAFFDVDPSDLEIAPLPPFYTWDSRAVIAHDAVAQPHHLSEAGPAAFDAAYSTKPGTNILPRGYALQAFRSLVLGRSSALFQWKELEQAFQPTITNATVTGTSLSCSQGVIDELCAVGTALVILRDFAEPQHSHRRPCSALVALRTCVLQILDAVEDFISCESLSIRTILQLQYALARPLNLLRLLISLKINVKTCKTNEAIVSVVADFVEDKAELAPAFALILRAILLQVSTPWLEQLARDIGFCSSADHLAGGTVDSESAVTDMTKFSFVHPEDRELIQATKNALDIVRTHDPNHPLLTCDFQGIESPHTSFVDPRLSHAQVILRAAKYRLYMLDHVASRRRRPDHATESNDAQGFLSRHNTRPTGSEDPWRLSDINELNIIMSQELRLREEKSTQELGRIVSSALKRDVDEAAGNDLDPTTPSALETLRPLLEIQHRFASGAVLRQMFRTHHLLEHLALHRSFYLFGSSDFVSELSVGLFSPELQSAERKRGVVSSTEVMGLRLGHGNGQNWPPASSELCLVLMGVLSRVTGMRTHGNGQQLSNMSDVQEGLNFAVRELPEAEIEQTLDMHSIHALDFLGLQYNAPAPLDRIVTAEASKDYDAIFRFLLIALRMLYITSNLARSLADPKGDTHNLTGRHSLETATFIHLAHHLVTVTLSHFMDVGITAPWQDFLHTLQTVEQDLAWEDAHGEIGSKVHVGLEWLRKTHITCLGRMRNRLFLRNKQQKIRVALENAFTSILTCNHILQDNGVEDEDDVERFADAHRSFRAASEEVCIVLQESVDKALISSRTMEIEEAEVHRILLSRLRWDR
jgi:hypothetical protein